MPDEEQIIIPEANGVNDEENNNFEDDQFTKFPTTINEKLKDLITDNPNKLMGCGG